MSCLRRPTKDELKSPGVDFRMHKMFRRVLEKVEYMKPAGRPPTSVKNVQKMNDMFNSYLVGVPKRL